MRTKLVLLAASIAAAACYDNSDLTSQYGTTPAGGAPSTGGSGAAGTSGQGGQPSGGQSSGGHSGGASGSGVSGSGGQAGGGAGGQGGGGASAHGGASGQSGGGQSAGGGGQGGQPTGGQSGGGQSAGGEAGQSTGGQPGGGQSAGGQAGQSGGGQSGGGQSAGGQSMGGQSMGGAGAGGAGAGGGGAGGAGGGGAGGAGAGGGGAAGAVTPVCGNGVVEPGEACDTGSGVAKNGCYPTCTTMVAFANGAYTEVTGDVLNPERGFQDDVDLTTPQAYDWVRPNGSTVAYAYTVLPSKTAPLDATYLSTLQQGFDDVRAAHIKVRLRFTYNASTGSDAPKSVVLQHIQDLTPILQKNVDVIAWMDAGFIGDYGDWYNSTNGLDNTTDELDIVTQELMALPASRDVNLPTPMAKNAMYPGGPLVAANAWTGVPKARTGHSDDNFLVDATDSGVYATPVQTWKDYIHQDAQFVPMIGSSWKYASPYGDCPSATADLAYLRFSTLDIYDPMLATAWMSQGCYASIQNQLGYRLHLASAQWTQSVPPGGALGITVDVKNEGYAAPVNPRPFRVVLTDGANRWVADVATVDVRTWQPGDTALELWFRVPTSIPAGSYQVAVWMPDAASTLESIGDYAIAIADQGVFNLFTGDNVLGTVTIDPAAPGGTDPAAMQFAYLPP